jgi:hypothetical protein
LLAARAAIDSKTVWDGIVHVFKIDGHPQARKAYAWSSPIEGSGILLQKSAAVRLIG